MESFLKSNHAMKRKRCLLTHQYYSIKLKEKLCYGLITRILDIMFALLGLMATLPIIVFIAALIKMEDKGPAFFKQERLGKDGKVFCLYKLRSMKTDAQKYGMQWAEKDDPRVTKIGKFIRKMRIDELPQLINILIGDMSLIGPRPEVPALTLKFEKETPGFINRLMIKPGLTGWAQVNGGYDISYKEKLILDIYYIEHRGPWLDIKIIFKTIHVVLTGDGAR